MAVNITTGRPISGVLQHDLNIQMREIQNLFNDLLDQLQNALYNLDSGNVTEAASVQAANIDTSYARIVDAQIKNLTADKLTAGTIDTSEINISGSGGRLRIQDNMLVFSYNGIERLLMGTDTNGNFGFMLRDNEGKPTLVLADDGSAVFTGAVKASTVEGSTVVGGKVISAMLEGYNASGQKHGLWSNPGAQFADVEIWHNGNVFFKISNQFGSAQMAVEGKAFLETRGAETTLNGNWKIGGSPLASQQWVRDEIARIAGA